MAWTNVSKPTGTNFTNVNVAGHEQYDQANILYDDASVFYDGVNQLAYTKIAKPISPSWTSVAKPV